MRVGDTEFGRVAILVLDYDPYREDAPGAAIVRCYQSACQELQRKYKHPGKTGLDVVVCANNDLVAKHQRDLEDVGVLFYPGWRDSTNIGTF